MRYVRNVVAAAAAIATAFVRTVLACFTGIRCIRTVYLAIMPSIVVVLYCLIENE